MTMSHQIKDVNRNRLYKKRKRKRETRRFCIAKYNNKMKNSLEDSTDVNWQRKELGKFEDKLIQTMKSEYRKRG